MIRSRNNDRLALDNNGITCAVFLSPLGWAGVAVSELGVCKVVLPREGKRAVQKELSAPLLPEDAWHGLLGRSAHQLRHYLSGERVSFDLLLNMRYYTSFQRAVWQAAAEIPYGETRSYAWIAMRIRNRQATRAVGQALGANPVPIIIPCHRVISSAGTLGGFSGGLSMKQQLLDLEAKQR